MGFYPITPSKPVYTITKPLFDRITIQLDSKYYQKKELVIERQNATGTIKDIRINGKPYNHFFVTHDELVNGNKLQIILK